MNTQNLHMNDSFINSLARSLVNGKALDNVPALVTAVIKNEAWRERFVSQTKRVASFQSFREFVEAYPPEGLHTTLDNLMRVCWFHGDTEAIALLVSEGADLSVLRTEQRRLAGLIEQLEQGKVTA